MQKNKNFWTMWWHLRTNASYLSKPQAQSHVGGYLSMLSYCPIPPCNGVVLNITQLIKLVMTSAAETESGALFINIHEAVLEWMTLRDVGHSQPWTPMQTDDSMAQEWSTATFNQEERRQRAWDSIGCKTKSHKDSSSTAVYQAGQAKGAIGKNITVWFITKTKGLIFWHQPKSWKHYRSCWRRINTYSEWLVRGCAIVSTEECYGTCIKYDGMNIRQLERWRKEC